MLSRRLQHLAQQPSRPFVCLVCSAHPRPQPQRYFTSTPAFSDPKAARAPDAEKASTDVTKTKRDGKEKPPKPEKLPKAEKQKTLDREGTATSGADKDRDDKAEHAAKTAKSPKAEKHKKSASDGSDSQKQKAKGKNETESRSERGLSRKARRRLKATAARVRDQGTASLQARIRTIEKKRVQQNADAEAKLELRDQILLDKMKEMLLQLQGPPPIRKVKSDGVEGAWVEGQKAPAPEDTTKDEDAEQAPKAKKRGRPKAAKPAEASGEEDKPKSLAEAMGVATKTKSRKGGAEKLEDVLKAHMTNLPIEVLDPSNLHFEAIDHEIPPIPQLAYGLDRVLFNSGVYRLQDPRSRVYNFDPYLEKIMPVTEFDFDAIGEYKTSSRDEDLLAMTRKLKTKFTGSTSSMSGVLQHFHFLLSSFRGLNHDMLSRKFPNPSKKFSKITMGPSAIFLRWKNGVHAIDADKSYDSPNIMSWLGNSMERLLTTEREAFERYRRSNPETPDEGDSGRCFHYSKLGNFLVRSQLDAQDSRLPGSGVFDLKTRAVVSIRMDHQEYEVGSGYQLRYDHGMWESFEREFYDMTRATMLKYSLQVRMGRMDGIFVAYHNIERIFGFQYLPLPDMDLVLHGQTDTCLGDQEFKMSVSLLDELLQRATEKYPEQTLRLHFEAQGGSIPYMYIFAEPVTDEQADEIQNAKNEARLEFERTVIGVKRDDPDVQAQWHNIQERVDEEVEDDELNLKSEVEEDTEVDGDIDAHTAFLHDEPIEQQERTESEESSSTETEESASSEAESEATETTVPELESTNTPAEPEPEKPSGPLLGWTLTIRNRVNAQYVERPENLTPDDDWTVEYHIKEIPDSQKWTLYENLKKRRQELFAQEKKEQKSSLDSYRQLIQKYSKAGRKWREQQDEIDREMGAPELYRPRGPGSEKVLAWEDGAGTEGKMKDA